MMTKTFKSIYNWFKKALSREIELKEGYLYDDGEIRIIRGKISKKEKREIERLEKLMEGE